MNLFKQLLKVITVLFLSLNLLFTVAGCGGGSSDAASDAAGSEVAGVDGGGGIGGSGIDPSDPSDGGIGGSGVVAVGPIDAFGSICVNSVCYDIDDADVFLNGNAGAEDDLALGMFVRLQGTINEDGTTGAATRVDFETYIGGRIDQISLSENGIYKVITVLNTNILVHPNDTFLEGATFDELVEGQFIEASGRLLEDGVLLTTQATIAPPESIQGRLFIVRLTSTIAEVKGNILTLESGLEVNIASALLSAFTADGLLVGQTIEIVGGFDGDTITADSVTLQLGDGLFQPLVTSNMAPQQLLGQIDNFVSNADFTVLDIAVDASGATIFPSFFTLADNQYVSVAGTFENNTLVADTIFVQDLLEEGTVTNIDLAASSITVALEQFVASIDVLVNADTNILSAGNGLTEISLSELSINDPVTVALSFDENNALVADEIVVVSEFVGVTTSDPAAAFDDFSVTSGTYTATDEVIVANYTQAEVANLTLVLGENDFGRIVALQSLMLDGSLTITNDGRSLVAGETFDLFDGDIQGSFTALQLPALETTYTWDISELYTTGTLQVVTSQAMQLTTDSNLSSTVRFRFFGLKLGTVTIDWGDGNADTVTAVPGVYEHTYATNGQRAVRIVGGFTGFGWEGETPDPQYTDAITAVTRWGNNSIMSLHGAFRDHDNLTDVPDDLPTTVSDLRCMLCDTSNFNDASTANWNLENITNIAGLFQRARLFNQDISGWNVANVTDMSNLFDQAISFNQNLGAWDVSEVTSMSEMFNGASLSTSNYDLLLNGWQTQNLNSGVDFDAGGSQYSGASSAARAQIISDFDWRITDGGPQ